MSVLSAPTIVPDQFEFGLISNTRVFRSPISGTVQTLETPGARWRLKATWSDLSDTEGRPLKAWLTSLNGNAGRFYWGDPSFLINGPSGVYGGNPLVAGGAQTGRTLTIDGASASITGWARAGDYVEFTNTAGGRELKMLTADVNTDAGGAAALSFSPQIRVSPADNAPLRFAGATAQFMLASPVNSWRLKAPMINSFSIEAVEAFIEAT